MKNASVPTHMVVGFALAQSAPQRVGVPWRFWLTAMVCSALPDVDVVGFRFGIHYGDLWGHRGVTHSLLFASLVGIIVGCLMGGSWAEKMRQSTLLFIITVSHGILDAMTNGGLGVAFLSPFDTHRYFLPWRPIQVSPLTAGRFVSARGMDILLNEIAFVWFPALIVGTVLFAIRKRQSGSRDVMSGKQSD